MPLIWRLTFLLILFIGAAVSVTYCPIGKTSIQCYECDKCGLEEGSLNSCTGLDSCFLCKTSITLSKRRKSCEKVHSGSIKLACDYDFNTQYCDEDGCNAGDVCGFCKQGKCEEKDDGFGAFGGDDDEDKEFGGTNQTTFTALAVVIFIVIPLIIVIGIVCCVCACVWFCNKRNRDRQAEFRRAGPDYTPMRNDELGL